MSELSRPFAARGAEEPRARADDPAFQAYQLLHVAFVVLPTVVGLDKFFHRLTNWNGYFAPSLARLSPVPVGTLMRAIGVVEIAVGLLVALRPRWGGYIVAAWLVGIIADLLIARDFYDIALRDFGLALAAIALARLATRFNRVRPRPTAPAVA